MARNTLMNPLHRLSPLLAVLALLLLLLLPLRTSADSVRVPAGELRSATLADLKPHPSGSKTYNEFWTYHFVLDGNILAYLNFSRVNLGNFKPPVCGADFNLLGFKGRNYSVAREYDKKNFQFADDVQRLQVHENIWFSGKLPETHHVFFSTRKKDVSYFLDLEFTEIMPGKVWGDGMFRLGSQSVGVFMNIPQAKVTGRLAINGDTVNVSGRAYMDHTFQSDLAPELVDAGFRYISQNGSMEVGYLMDPVAKYGKQPIGYGLRMQDGTVNLLKPQSMTALSATRALGVKIPARLEIAYTDGSRTVLERGADRLAQSTLHEFSGTEKFFIRRFMGGEIMTFRGLGTLNASTPVAYNFFIVD